VEGGVAGKVTQKKNNEAHGLQEGKRGVEQNKHLPVKTGKQGLGALKEQLKKNNSG